MACLVLVACGQSALGPADGGGVDASVDRPANDGGDAGVDRNVSPPDAAEEADTGGDAMYPVPSAGACSVECTLGGDAGPAACCNGQCVDLSQPTSCGTTCSTIAACTPGQSCCGGACVDEQTDLYNCGACKHACNSDPAACCKGSCTDLNDCNNCGSCGVQCAPGQSCCNGKLVPNDVANCGACGKVCTGATPACCSEVCSDLTIDDRNCGGCSNA